MSVWRSWFSVGLVMTGGEFNGLIFYKVATYMSEA